MSRPTAKKRGDAGRLTRVRVAMRCAWLASLVVGMVVSATHADEDLSGLPGQPPLKVVTAGGAFTRAQMRSVIGPYRAEQGRWVSVVAADGRVPEIERQVRAENVTWDVVTLNLQEAMQACRAGMLEPIAISALPAGADGRPAPQDFLLVDVLGDCAVGHSVWSSIVAYDPKALEDAPTRIADFFDLRRFPGRRGLRREPIVALEWALLAAGVPKTEVYAELRTEKGLRRAFRQLDRIRDEIVWWTEGEEAVELIRRGEVVMGAAWNGRVHVANERGGRLGILWDGQLLNMDVWAVPKGSQRRTEALDFVAWATRAEVLARQAREIPYGSARRSGLELVPEELRAGLPTSEAHRALGLQIDFAFWVQNFARLEARFEQWITRRPVFDFDRLGRE